MGVHPTNHPQYNAIVSVAEAVMAAERRSDESIKTLSNLIATTVAEFADARLPAWSAQPALDKLALSISGQIEGRRLLTEAHREYGRVAKSIGASADEWGPNWPCYTVEEAATPAPAPLRRVA